MNRQRVIKMWVNQIEKDPHGRWVFLGDGHGEEESRSGDVSIDALRYHIEWCNEQIKLSEEFLEEAGYNDQ